MGVKVQMHSGLSRRDFLGDAAMTFGGAVLGYLGASKLSADKAVPGDPDTDLNTANRLAVPVAGLGAGAYAGHKAHRLILDSERERKLHDLQARIHESEELGDLESFKAPPRKLLPGLIRLLKHYSEKNYSALLKEYINDPQALIYNPETHLNVSDKVLAWLAKHAESLLDPQEIRKLLLTSVSKASLLPILEKFNLDQLSSDDQKELFKVAVLNNQLDTAKYLQDKIGSNFDNDFYTELIGIMDAEFFDLFNDDPIAHEDLLTKLRRSGDLADGPIIQRALKVLTVLPGRARQAIDQNIAATQTIEASPADNILKDVEERIYNMRIFLESLHKGII